MAIAAQIFTSVFPILIVLGSWVHLHNEAVADTIGLPDETKQVLAAAIGSDTRATTFGIAGTLIVLISATSLSRALTRAYAAIWELPRPKTSLRHAWRWAATVTAMAISLVVVRAMTQAAGHLPRPDLWQVAVAASADVATALLLPWVLLAGVVRLRVLMPGAATYAVVMVPIRAASHLRFPEALDTSAAKYGTIGVAFTYIAWLYAIAFCLLVATVIGNVVATDQSILGRWIRGEHRTTPSATPDMRHH